MMLQRNLLYTAITRGKQLVIVIGMEKAVAMAVKNNESIERYSGLTEHFRIIEELMVEMEIFKRTKRRCRICKEKVSRNGYLYKCKKSKGMHAFWHRSVLSENLSDDEVLKRILDEANIPTIKRKRHHILFMLSSCQVIPSTLFMLA